MILDPQGSLVWTDTQFREPFNLDIQEYKGEPHLTFWAGEKLGAHGKGLNYIVNSSYHIVKVIKAGNDLDADLHEFNLLPSSNTALLVTYLRRQIDLRQMNDGPKDGWIWDGGFQEVDLETGEVLFDWRASDHVPLTKTYTERHDGDGLKADEAIDWFHINSVDKDRQGNYLVSARHLHALLCINSITSKIIWQLGGKDNMFRDLTDYTTGPDRPSPTNIALQHHARWRDNYTSITLFNNGADSKEPSASMWFDIDPVARTIRTRGVYISPSNVFAMFQGSMSILPSGNILLGYGSSAQYTEFTPDGTAICDFRFSPFKDFNTNAVESYRVFKGDWVGRPDTNPDVLLETDLFNRNKWMYISWMGATEVRNWRIEAKSSQHEEEEEEGTERAEETVVTIVTIPKDGFETAIDLSSHGIVADISEQVSDLGVPAIRELQFFRAVALDANDAVLGTSAWVDADEQLIIDSSASVSSSSIVSASSFSFSSSTKNNSKEPKQYFLPVTLAAVMIMLLGLLPCFWFLVVWLRKRHSLRNATMVAYQPVPGMEMSYS
ncbi:hypothetical protein DV736_g6604, partial [Chaetothyriales sp. CBS 134916]